jgi:hypothetical protein
VGEVLYAAVAMMTGTAAHAASGGHDHVLHVPIVIGPVILRVLLMGAIPSVAGFALMRAFLPEPSRTTVRYVVLSAAIAVLLELMLARALDVPSQLVVLLLAALVVPLMVALSGDPRVASLAAHARQFAPGVLSLASVFAFIEFVRASLGEGKQEVVAMLLHTGLVFALVGLSWVTLCQHRSRVARVLVNIEAGVLATAVAASAAQVALLQPH